MTVEAEGLSEPTGNLAPLTVAIVGCGSIAHTHAKVIAAHPRLRLVAAVDEVEEARESLAAMAETELQTGTLVRSTTLGEAFGATQIDLVVICTPSGLHVTIAEEAIAAGRHVIIEKPLDVSPSPARRLTELAREAEKSGQVVSVISQHRFDPASVVVSDAIAAGRFGRITSAVASVAWWRSQKYYDSGKWRGTWELDGGGAVMNQGVHTVDLLVWLLGTPVEISAQTALLAHQQIEVEDTAVATIRFESGALAVVHATTAAFPGLTVRLQVHGSQGSAIIDDDQLAYFHAARLSGDGPPDQVADVIGPGEITGAVKAPGNFVLGHLRQYEDVVRAIDTGTLPGVRVDDALMSLLVVHALYLSATLGRSISFAEVLAGTFDEEELLTGGEERVRNP